MGGDGVRRARQGVARGGRDSPKGKSRLDARVVPGPAVAPMIGQCAAFRVARIAARGMRAGPLAGRGSSGSARSHASSSTSRGGAAHGVVRAEGPGAASFESRRRPSSGL